MKLEAYLLESLAREKKTIEELLKIDNSIQKTDLTYATLFEKLKNSITLKYSMGKNFNVITDGDPDTTYTVLITFAPYIKNLHINRTFVAINKWLVEKTREYYGSKQLDIPIVLDVERSYSKYLEDDVSIFLYGFSEFVEGTKDIFFSKEIFVMNK